MQSNVIDTVYATLLGIHVLFVSFLCFLIILPYYFMPSKCKKNCVEEYRVITIIIRPKPLPIYVFHILCCVSIWIRVSVAATIEWLLKVNERKKKDTRKWNRDLRACKIFKFFQSFVIVFFPLFRLLFCHVVYFLWLIAYIHTRTRKMYREIKFFTIVILILWWS